MTFSVEEMNLSLSADAKTNSSLWTTKSDVRILLQYFDTIAWKIYSYIV